MAFDNACHVRHATVNKFDIKFVANLEKAVVWEKVFVNEVEGFFSYICFNFHDV